LASDISVDGTPMVLPVPGEHPFVGDSFLEARSKLTRLNPATKRARVRSKRPWNTELDEAVPVQWTAAIANKISLS